jgi:hypothetical protein
MILLASYITILDHLVCAQLFGLVGKSQQTSVLMLVCYLTKFLPARYAYAV